MGFQYGLKFLCFANEETGFYKTYPFFVIVLFPYYFCYPFFENFHFCPIISIF